MRRHKTGPKCEGCRGPKWDWAAIRFAIQFALIVGALAFVLAFATSR